MDMEVDDSVVEEFRNLSKNERAFSKNCSKLANDIQQGSSTIVQLVEQLKTLLVDTLPENRELGILILSQVLEALPRNILLTAQLNFICTFYADRLNDHHQVIPSALKGILALLQFDNVPEGSTKQILGSLFQNVPCQQQQQSDRHNIYRIFQICLEKQNKELHEMGFDLIYGVISAMDGERDPRNLLFLFNWLPKFLKNFTFGHLSEEMFEVMACYFPVDFRAPLQDPNSINREALAAALCLCLCAKPQFAEFCLPLALEKLSSSLHIAKLDALGILAEGCKTFELSAYVQHSTDIWSQIQREVLNCTDQELEDAALNTLEAVMNKLSQSTDEIYRQVLSDITDTLKGNLLPSMKLFIPSCKMLYYVAKASKASASYMTTEVVPVLINTYNITTTPSHQVLVFKNLIDFVRAYIDIHHNDNIAEVKELSVVPNLCLKATLHNQDEVRAAALLSLALIAKSLPADTRKCLYENLCVLLITPQPKIVRDSLLECFKRISQVYSMEVQANIIDIIKINNNESLWLYLDSLKVIADQEEFTAVILPIFMDYCTRDIETAQVATSCLRKLLENCEDNHQIQSFLVDKAQVTSKLTDWILHYLNSIDINGHLHKSLLVNINAILKLVIGHQSSDVQHSLIQSKMDIISKLYKNSHSVTLIIVFDGLLTRVHRDVSIKYDITDDLFELALNSEEAYVRQVALQLLANILNKKTDDENLQRNLNKIASSLDNCSTNGKLANIISMIAWVTKALVMKGCEQSEIWTNKLLELLQHHEEAAKGFKIIMNNDCHSLSTKSYCNIRLLYRQKFFTEITDKLAEKYKEENSNYLLAVGYLLQAAPQQVFIMQFKKIFRLVILCLEQCTDAEVLCAVLDALCSLIESNEWPIEEHLQEFLQRFLKLATFKPSMHVRVKALQCVQHYTTGYPLYKLLPVKQSVIHSLSQCLDDKKRLVRKEAVKARLCWFMLDAPI